MTVGVFVRLGELVGVDVGRSVGVGVADGSGVSVGAGSGVSGGLTTVGVSVACKLPTSATRVCNKSILAVGAGVGTGASLSHPLLTTAIKAPDKLVIPIITKARRKRFLMTPSL